MISDSDSSYSNLSISFDYSNLHSRAATSFDLSTSDSVLCDIAPEIAPVDESLLCQEEMSDLDDDTYSQLSSLSYQ